MGVQLSDLLPSKEVELEHLSGKKIAIDAYNTLYQFLSIIRDKMTGEPLRDSKGRVTSHLSGLFYRTSNLIEAGIKPVFVFDGKPPEFKKKTIEEREKLKEEARKKWEEALEKGEKAITYAQAAAALTEEMIEDSKKLLDYMGIPWVQAISEGEAQCAYMCKKGSVDFTGSQDFDSLLFGSPRLVRNLSITGKRKLPRKEVYVEIKPEIIELAKALEFLGIDQKQLIIIGILVGTDYAEGIKGVGPKTALKLVKEHKSLEKVLEKVRWEAEVETEDILNFFLKPPVTDKYKIEWKEPNREKIIEFMVGEHDFSKERVEKVVDKLEQAFSSGRQTSLKGWFK
ncbi:MAG: flap endonuclease-1 [Candidatus Aenigmarchaeota archaeon]|nr:flap endonuclease-1 [Candidatus Aenigmarchaeota archaeon]